MDMEKEKKKQDMELEEEKKEHDVKMAEIDSHRKDGNNICIYI